MRYKVYGKSGLKGSSLAVGSWGLSNAAYSESDNQEAIVGIRTMIDHGVNLVDTAPSYADGHAEELVGRALKDGYREKVFLATKFGIPFEYNYVNDTSYKNCVRELELSLKRLNVDYVDVFYIHWPDPKTPIEETMTAMNDLKEAGKIRHIGVSNFNIEQIEEARKYGDVEFIQPPFSMVDQRCKDLMLWGNEQNLANVTYGSLGGGILTGAYRTIPDWAPDDFRFTFYDSFREPKFSRVQKLLKLLDEIAAGHNGTVAQVSINWSTQKDYVSTAMCGVRGVREAIDNCSAFDWELTEEEMEAIDSCIKENRISERQD